MRKTILILAANPKNTPPLRLDQEAREIGNGLERAQKRDEFILKQKLAVRPVDVRRAMLDDKPNIVHFCGHGSENEGIVFEDENGYTKLVGTDTLAGFFELFADKVECVILNACYSEVQAEAIARHIPYVIGMKKAIGDTAAIEFAIAFYDALGAGESVEFAYKLACNAIQWAGIPEHLTPVIKSSTKVKTGDTLANRKINHKFITTNTQDFLSVLDTNVLEITRWIYSFQRNDGSFPSDNNDIYSCTWTTAKILWGLLMSNPQQKTKPVARFLSWLDKNQNSDGGMAFIKRGDPSIVDATTAYIATLTYTIKNFGNIDAKNRLEACLRWLVNNQRDDGGWNWYPNSLEPAMTSSSAFAILALYSSQQVFMDSIYTKSMEKGLNWIVSSQNKDGGWGSEIGDISRPGSTAIVLWSLAELGYQNNDLKHKLDNGCSYLLTQQHANGSWRNTIERSAGITITRLSTPYSLIGLLRNGLPPTMESIQKGYSFLMQTYEKGKFIYEDAGIFTWPTADGLMATIILASHLKIE